MRRFAEANVAMICHVAAKLEDLIERVVFLGGAATALLITDTATGDVRPTLDVDVIAEVASTAEYHRLAGRLRSLGFREDASEGAPLCRWRIDGIAVDVMPIDEATLGFSNRWYDAALRHAVVREVGGIAIRVVTAPYFLATKIDAFHGRGKGDFVASHDIEDIVTLIDGRSEILEEVANAPDELRIFLSATFQRLLANRYFLDALPGHLLSDAASQNRLPLLKERMRKLSETA